MIQWICFGVFLFFVLLFTGCGLLKGRKYVWMYSAARIVTVILSAALSVLFSVLLAKALAKVLYNVIANSGILGEAGGILQDVASVPDAICALGAMVLAPVLFIFLFLISKALLNLGSRAVTRAIVKKMAKGAQSVAEQAGSEKDESEKAKPAPAKEKKNRTLRTKGLNPIGMVCGAVCGFLLCIVLMIPTVGTVVVADRLMGVVAANTDDTVVASIDSTVDAVANHAGAKMVRVLGGDLIYSALTTYKVGDERVSLMREIDFLTVVGDAVAAVNDDTTARVDAAQAVRDVAPAFADSDLVPVLLSDFLGAAAESWKEGESFHGIKKPSMTEDVNELIDALLDILSTSDSETIKNDIGTVLNVLAEIVEEDALDELTKEPISVLGNKDLTAEVIYQLLENERMSPLIGEITDFGIQMLGKQIGADLSGVALNTLTVADTRAEATAIADALSEASKMMASMNGDASVIVDTIKNVGSLLDSFAATEMIGKENTGVILEGILTSEQISSSMGLSAEDSANIAQSINSGADSKDYASMMNSLGQTVEVIQMTTQSGTDSAQTTEKVEALLNDLTPESATVLEQVATPSLMVNQGVPEQSAEPISNLVSDMFGGLSDAKENGMSEAEYRKEAQATTDLLNIAMGATQSESKTVFGAESATGKEATEVVESIFDSSVISQTIVDTVYPEGTNEPVQDPLNTGKSLNESEKQEFVDALNARWSSASEKEKADESYQQLYVALGAMMNLELQITDTGIVG